jgi:monovalent cation:H+ antiporter-2, CPA2 family
MENFGYIIILLTCAVVFVSICRKLSLPPIIGYLCVGILVGPGGIRWIPAIENMHTLAEFGVVFLMFTLGLEFSIPRLIATKRVLLGVGGMQVLICTLAGMLAGISFNLDFIQAFLIGGALALSSTAVVIKQLTEQKEQNTPHGQLSINILLFQDIASVLFLILISALSGNGDNSLPMTFLITTIKGVGSFIGMALLGQWVLRPLFHSVARAHSTELFMMATLLVVLSASGVTYIIGLSFPLGAFLAGMMLGETEFRHQIEIDIRPFRDVLLGLFFIIIGAYLRLDMMPAIWGEVLLILLILILAKAVLIMLIAATFGKASSKVAFKTGTILAHGGEFGFVVLTEAINKQLVEPGQRPAIFAAVVLSLMCAPFFIRYNKTIYHFLFGKKEKSGRDLPSIQLQQHVAELDNHVILCGFGRVGQILARFLEQENIKWLSLDLDPMRISKSSMAGEHSFYGDAAHPETLIAAGLAKARMVVVTFSDEHAALDVVRHVRAMRLDVPVFVRTRDDSNLVAFQKAGATEVVPESLEGSLMLASHLLLTLGVPTTKVITKLRKVHTDRYGILQGYYTGTDDVNALEEDSTRSSLHSVPITEGAFAANKTIEEVFDVESVMHIRSITRDAKRYPAPNTDFMILPGDVIVILATPEEQYILEEKILQG